MASAALCSALGDFVQIKKQLISTISLCKERGLLHSAKWASEVAFALDPLPKEELPPSPEFTEEDAKDIDALTLAKSYFDVKEYDRAADFLKGCCSKKAYFLYMYSRYLSGEKKKDDENLDSLGPLENGQVRNEALRDLRVELTKRHAAADLDGFTLYLYGVVLRKLGLMKEAVDVFVEAIHALPLHWGAWLELSNLVTHTEMLKSLSLPDCWIRDFFMAHMYTELGLSNEALQKYQSLMEAGFSKSTYIISQMAVVNHNIRDTDKALALFNELREQDPFRIDNMNTFSNVLHVKKMKTELSHLAQNLAEIDKYRAETCCVIGNYYSMCCQREKAAFYFQRALKLNPQCLDAWTLMGHEHMEMKNTSAAIQAYRHATEVNKRDYRAWIGLGLTYESLRMPFYSLYYYRKAHQLRPNESHLLVALGKSYESLSRKVEAKKCYWRAYSVGDVQKIALFCLAKLHEQLNESDAAAQCYMLYLQDIFSCKEQFLEHAKVSTALRYLGQYYFEKKLYDEAFVCAKRCCDYNETRKEGKALLTQISQVRDPTETPSAHLFAPLSSTPVWRSPPLQLSFTPIPSPD